MAPAAAASFAPTDVTGLKVWLKADSLGLADGAGVASWTDSSGLGNHFAQGTGGNQPIYKTGIINSLAVVRFTAASAHYLTGPSLAALTAAEVFIVIKINTDPPATQPKTGLWRFDTSGQITHFPFTDGTIYDAFGSTARKTTVNPTPSLASAFRLYNVTSAAGEWTSRLDTTQLFTTATNTVGMHASPQLGMLAATECLDGDVAELILYDNKVSSGDRASLAAYLKAKYALTGF